MPTGTEQPKGFGDTLESSLERLQTALRRAMIEAGVQKPGPTAIGRSLGLDKSIAWKIGRITTVDHPLEALEFLPGAQGARIVVEACSKGGCSEEVCRELDAAFRELERDIKHHAGDRGTARAMARATLSTETPILDENLRRDHFRTTSAIWGAQARVQLKADFIAPGKAEGSFDTASFEGLVDLQRLRPDVSWRLARKRIIASIVGIQQRSFEPLDPSCADGQSLPLFTRYCSQPLPSLSTRVDSEGFVNYDLEPGSIGRTGAVNCMIATRCEAAVTFKDDGEQNNVLAGAQVRTPTELLVLDYFVHRSVAPIDAVTAGLRGQIRMSLSDPFSGQDEELPVPFPIESLSTRPGAQALLEVPNHANAVQDAVRMAGDAFGHDTWRLEDFIGFRVRLTYPPIPSFGFIRTPLPYPR